MKTTTNDSFSQSQSHSERATDLTSALRFMPYKRSAVLAHALTLALTSTAGAAPENTDLSKEELADRLQKLEQRYEALLKRVEAQEASTPVVHPQSSGDDGIPVLSDGPAPSGSRFGRRTHIGGYGELAYQNFDNEPGSTDGEDFERLDFRRFVLFFGHEFTDRLRFFSELELEHAFVGEEREGELELEQAYLEYDLNPNHHLTAGLQLIPVGILNETHEPNTFYGVTRNAVENVIIPTTWREIGIGSRGQYANGLRWDLLLTSGLNLPADGGSNAFRVRSGRTSGSEVDVNGSAVTARVKYTGVPGLELGAAVQYNSDASANENDGVQDGILSEAHIAWNWRGLGLRALYARWDFSGDAITAAGADSQDGWYIEPSYRFPIPLGELGVYGRYLQVDAFRLADQFREWEGGFNFWPHPDVVVKANWRSNLSDVSDERDFNGVELGLGYQF